MSNPWLNIPLDDYECHMALPEIGQASMLAEQFDRGLNRWAPKSVALIGCAGGNGLDRIEGRSIGRILGVDINPHYIERTRARYANRFSCLDLICADVQSDSLTYEPVDFTFAALLFEYVDVGLALKTLRRNCRTNAVLTTVLQLPHSTINAVSSSPFKSLGRLASSMELVAPDTLCHAARDVGFMLVEATEIETSSGKRFSVQSFQAN